MTNARSERCTVVKSKHPLYGLQRDILARCYHKEHHAYKNYGGRGILVHDAWHDFWSFARWVKENLGDKPSPDHSFDRIDNDGCYEPGNVRWATAREQRNNQRSSRIITFKGITKPLTEWADELGFSRHTLAGRLKMGWTIEKTLTAPLGNAGRPRKRAA